MGAVCTFLGTVRDRNAGDAVCTMELEHYPGMTERSIEGMIDEAMARFDLFAARVIHRVGLLQPLDQIVLVVVTSAHRGESFQACEFLMDYLKTQAPFWKKEQTPAARAGWMPVSATTRRWPGGASPAPTHDRSGAGVAEPIVAVSEIERGHLAGRGAGRADQPAGLAGAVFAGSVGRARSAVPLQHAPPDLAVIDLVEEHYRARAFNLLSGCRICPPLERCRWRCANEDLSPVSPP